MARWPRDPHQLLGVVWGVSARDLRRAYLHLIRTYKPEHAPEQFRRIREAYETLLAYASFSISPTTNDDGPSSIPADETSSPAIGASSKPEALPRDPWDLACEGDAAAAYRILSDRLETGRPREETYLQLYWLLVTHPSLDPDHEPYEVLIRGLQTCGTSAHLLRGLLEREVEADPTRAIGECSWFLSAPDASSEFLPGIVGIRWRAARKLERWQVVIDDLGALRPRTSADEDVWTRILIAAASNLVWAEKKSERTRLKAINKELKTLGRNTLDLDEPLFRLDYAHEIGKDLIRLAPWGYIISACREFTGSSFRAFLRTDLGAIFRGSFTFSWRRHKRLVTGLHRLLALSWDGPDHRADSIFRSHLARVAKDPKAALKTMELVAARAPAVFARLAVVLDESGLIAPSDPSESFDPPALAAVEGFLKSNRWWKYPKFRRSLLDFCLREMLDPAAIVWNITGRAEYAISPNLHLAQAIAADRPLLYVCRAVQAFAADRLPP
jgi:hypothetical protein